MTIHKHSPKASLNTAFSSISVSMYFYRIVVISGVILSLFAFPLDMFKQVRLGDAIIPLLTVFCAIKLYGNKKLKAGYTKGYHEAFVDKDTYSLLHVGLDGIKPSTSTL